MAAADVFDSVTAGNFASRIVQQSQDAQDGQNYLMQVTRLGHQANIDARNAFALQEAKMSAQGREILQTQAAMNAPRQTAPAYVPEAAGVATVAK